MRINRFLALATGMSRRAADKAIANGRVAVNKLPADTGQEIAPNDAVTLDGKPVSAAKLTTIILHKPVGYVVSRDGQGSKTIYDLLPTELHNLKPVGRLDKESSGLLLLTNDGKLANELTHPSNRKEKIYQIELDKVLSDGDRRKVQQGVTLEDGISKLGLAGRDRSWTVTMREGRNRQIRRTFSALGYRVIRLHRVQFGEYELGKLENGAFVNA